MSSLVPVFRPTGSALHRVRPGVAAAYVLAPCVVALTSDHPLVLAAALACVVTAGICARVGRELKQAARLAVPLALLVAAINPLVSRQGLTVIAEGPVLPLYGALDITLEAVTYGALAGLRVLVVILAFALCSAAIDPDHMVRALRRVAPRSALTAALAIRTVPLLVRDAERLATAYRLRAATVQRADEGRLRRAAVLARALAAGGLERSFDTAAALELRGYALRRRSSRMRAPWSRDDRAFATAAGALLGAAIAAPLAGVAAFEPYPLLQAEAGVGEAALALALVATAAAPFALAARRRVSFMHREVVHA